MASDVFAPDEHLAPVLARRGTEASGSDERLSCLRRRLQQGGRVVVGTLGGSISAGSTTYTLAEQHGRHLYHSRVVRTLDKLYPSESPHVNHNGAIAAAGPTYFERCLRNQLPEQSPSLVFVEFATNILHHLASYERVLRALLMLQPQPAIIAVHSHTVRHRIRLLRPRTPADTCALR